MSLGISISRMKPGCPWENGYQESFYGKFEIDFDDAHRFASFGKLIAEVYRSTVAVAHWEKNGFIPKAKRNSRSWRIYTKNSIDEIVNLVKKTRYFSI